ncbi:MAG: diguanylate cyclase [Hydrogenovibrio sp.]|uniref:GGDEF domain-containing protein n=1 Tax=Hydrogenovibrio sp. TaxID=2065821 RepID=UPI00286FE7BC|nr:diguanylate cyclase [Hydrogenovibrio sp.]MDR9499958.1 diguanylate cyclase [Hydrogenovibrio sp.]
MISLEQMPAMLNALPDPVFVFSKSGQYIAVYGGRDTRYYHDGSGLVGSYISDLIKPDKANWFMDKIDEALRSRVLLIEEYELSNKDVKGLPDEGPEAPIWFEGRVQALDFQVEGEEVVLWVASNISERHNMESKLREQSDTDQLTGVFNRRRLETDLITHFDTFDRYQTPTSVLMFDIDNLKLVNDQFGHAVGDALIMDAARISQSELRKTDLICRFGGDEFIIVLPETGLDDAAQFAERLKASLKQGLQKFCTDDATVTASLGVTTVMPTDNSYQDTLQRADAAMYAAKKDGKNQVVIG